MTWRKKAAAVIERVLGENQDADEKTLRAALRAAYPFGLYGQYYPYKVWCEEVRKSIAKHEATRCPACFGRGWVGNDMGMSGSWLCRACDGRGAQMRGRR